MEEEVAMAPHATVVEDLHSVTTDPEVVVADLSEWGKPFSIK